jgi:hypothetical protein
MVRGAGVSALLRGARLGRGDYGHDRRRGGTCRGENLSNELYSTDGPLQIDTSRQGRNGMPTVLRSAAAAWSEFVRAGSTGLNGLSTGNCRLATLKGAYIHLAFATPGALFVVTRGEKCVIRVHCQNCLKPVVTHRCPWIAIQVVPCHQCESFWIYHGRGGSGERFARKQEREESRKDSKRR